MAVRIGLVDPYLGGSHLAWAEGYARHSRHDVAIFGLPPSFWKWRMQGAHVTLAPRLAADVAEHGPFDVLLTTSMTNVAALLGLARRELGTVPVAFYLHENQLTFPLSPHDREDLTYAMVNWTSMVASDLVVFNSDFHRDAWFDALPGFLARFPDHRHGALIAEVTERTTVLPVGCDLLPLDAVPRERGGRPLVLWNQRWEYDKGPAEFAAAVMTLLDEGDDVDVALAGERFADEPPILTALRDRLGERLVHDGYAAPDEYRRLLRRADIVVSTAHHEFFGIAITEAVYAGAFPVAPNRLVYPERIPVAAHARCLYDDAAGLLDRLRWAVAHPNEAAAIAADIRPALAACDWTEVAPRYDAVLGGLAG